MKDGWGAIVWLFAIAWIIMLLFACPIMLAGAFLAMIIVVGLVIGSLVLVAKLWEYGGVGRIAAVGVLILLAWCVYDIVQHPEGPWIENVIRYLATWDWKVLLALLGVIAVAVLFGPGIWPELKVLLPRLRLEYEYWRVENKVTQLIKKLITEIVRLSLRPGFAVSMLTTIGSNYMWKLILPDGEIEIAVLPGGLDEYPFDEGNNSPWRRGYSWDSLYKAVEQIPFLTLIQPRFVVFEVVRDKNARVIAHGWGENRTYLVKDDTRRRVIFETKGMDFLALERFILKLLWIDPLQN